MDTLFWLILFFLSCGHMKHSTLALFVVMIFLNNTLPVGAQTEVTVTPLWKVGEKHNVKIKNTTTAERSGNTATYITTWDAQYTLISLADTGYTVEWLYTNCQATPNDPAPENQVIAKLLNIKLLIKLDNQGKFACLLNADEVRLAANKIVDGIIAGYAGNPPAATQFKAVKQLMATNQGLEIALLKQIKFHQFSFGYTYQLGHIQTNNLKFPNPLGGEKVDAVEHVKLTNIDATSHTCTVETDKLVDGKQAIAMVIDYMKKASAMDAKTIESEISKQHIEVSESSMQEIDYTTSLVLKSYFKRTMDFGFQNMVTLLEIETAR